MKQTIKVIKSAEWRQRAEILEARADVQKTGGRERRELAATVSTWVFEHKRRGKADAKRAFHSLFTNAAPQATGA